MFAFLRFEQHYQLICHPLYIFNDQRTLLRVFHPHFLVNRVSEPLVRSELAITLELKLCLPNFSKEIERQKEDEYYFNSHGPS